MGLEKLDTRLGFFVGRGEDVSLPVCVRVRKPVEKNAAAALKKLGVIEEALSSRRFVFSLTLGAEAIKELTNEPWVVKIILRTN